MEEWSDFFKKITLTVVWRMAWREVKSDKNDVPHSGLGVPPIIIKAPGAFFEHSTYYHNHNFLFTCLLPPPV